MKYAEANDDNILELVHAFYGKARQDPEIGPIFEDAIDDWEHHFGKLADFWSDVTQNTNRFEGTPMAAHMKLTKMKPHFFARWLLLWEETVLEIFEPEAAEPFIANARRIARGMSYGIFQYRPASAPPLED